MKTKLTGRFWRAVAFSPITGWIFWKYIEIKSRKEDKEENAKN